LNDSSFSNCVSDILLNQSSLWYNACVNYAWLDNEYYYFFCKAFFVIFSEKKLILFLITKILFFQHEFLTILKENILFKSSAITKFYSIISEYCEWYDQLSDINKILYFLSQKYTLDFYCDFSDCAIFCSLTDFLWREALLLQMYEINLSYITFCYNYFINRDSFNEYVINTFSDKHKLLNDACANYVWNNNKILYFIDYLFWAFFL